MHGLDSINIGGRNKSPAKKNKRKEMTWPSKVVQSMRQIKPGIYNEEGDRKKRKVESEVQDLNKHATKHK